MPCDTTISPAYDPLSQYSYSSSASSSLASASVWSGSDTASQTSDDASISTTSSDNDSWQSIFLYQASSTANQAIRRHPEALNQQQQSAPIPIPAVPAELRQNPRRTASSSGSSGCHPPSLVRQSDRKVNFVDSLVGTFLLLT